MFSPPAYCRATVGAVALYLFHTDIFFWLYFHYFSVFYPCESSQKVLLLVVFLFACGQQNEVIPKYSPSQEIHLFPAFLNGKLILSIQLIKCLLSIIYAAWDHRNDIFFPRPSILSSPLLQNSSFHSGFTEFSCASSSRCCWSKKGH